jgi:endonuclease/exonuclease/phosphatase family metal-dependent hydrolase
VVCVVIDENAMVTLLTLNLRFGLADDGPNSWQYRQTCYPELFKSYRPDFITFQEANDFQIDFLKLILTGYKCIGKRTAAPKSWQNNLIFYHRKYRCLFDDRFYLSHVPDIPSRFPGSKWPRQCTMGIFETARHQIIVATTHLDFDADVQSKSARLITERISSLPSTLPAILAGDFNSTPSGACHQIFTGQKGNCDLPGGCFKNVFTEPFPGTHHGFMENATGDHIDWILYRGQLSPTDCGVIQKKFNGRYPSDHFPVYASFRWGVGENSVDDI